jgi:predicted regulator of Ras-like GTPase activity (Roadblock/LC7/MglB family)
MSDLRPLSGEPVSRSGRLDRVVSDLMSQAPEIEAAAVVSFDGLPMVSALPASMNEDRVAAMSAALLSLGERAAEGLGRGELSQVYIEGEAGTVYLVSCDNEAVLVAVAAAGAKAGLMLYEVRRAAIAVANVLREDDAAALQAQAAHEAQQRVHDVMAHHQQPSAPLYQPPAAPVSVPSYAPVGAPESNVHAGNGNGAAESGGQNANGWTSYAPSSPLPGEPTPWS